jgi:hypothetical protein
MVPAREQGGVIESRIVVELFCLEVPDFPHLNGGIT